MLLFLQIFVVICFIIVIIALFNEKADFLVYSIAAMTAAVVATIIIIPEKVMIDDLILAIEWEVVFFLIAVFTIVEILEDKHFFQEVALRITNKFHTNTRKFFWIICIISTLCAAFIEDISVAIIFIPMIIRTCHKMKINPAPFLLGMTICINLASTLTPFGSSQNILIANKFKLSGLWFILSLGLYFLIATLITLLLLDHFILKKHMKDIWIPHCEEYNEPSYMNHICSHDLMILEEHIDKKVFNRNFIGIIIFILLLFIVPNLLLVGIIGALIFVIINPREDESGKKRPDISYYLSKIDYKLIFFFITLFILVYCMEVNGTVDILIDLILQTTPEDLFIICLVILISTSILSAFLDNVPVTILYIPIIEALIVSAEYAATPLLIAFILGINLGGNLLPQGAACDMLTLEFAKKNQVPDVDYKRLLKVGGLFALLHIILGIGYLWLYIYVIM